MKEVVPESKMKLPPMLDALPGLPAPGLAFSSRLVEVREGAEACWTIFQSAVIGVVLKELCAEVLNQSMKSHVIVRTGIPRSVCERGLTPAPRCWLK